VERLAASNSMNARPLPGVGPGGLPETAAAAPMAGKPQNLGGVGLP
jgi:hypothetical protein